MSGSPFSTDSLLLPCRTWWSSQIHMEVMCHVEKYCFIQFLLNLLLNTYPGLSISPVLLNGKSLYRHVSAIYDYMEIYSVSWREHVFIDFQYAEVLQQICSPSLSAWYTLCKVRWLSLSALQDGAHQGFKWWCRFEVLQSLLMIAAICLLFNSDCFQLHFTDLIPIIYTFFISLNCRRYVIA